MASRIAGITIEIGGNTTKLQKSLDGVNKKLKSTSTALKDVNKLLKLNPGNTELLTQKQKKLTEAITLTKERLEQLKKAQDSVQKGSAEWDALQREIIATEGDLKGLQAEMRNFGSVSAQQLKAVGGKLKEAGGKIEDVGRKLAGVSAGAAAIGAGLLKLGYSAVQSADDLNTLSKQTGISTDELQKMKYASDLIDVSLEDITGALRKMKPKMDENNETFQKLGVSVTNADGSLRSATDVFYDSVKALSGISNETERDQIAMALFGKSADQLAGIIDDGGAALRKYGEEAENLGLIMSGDTLDALNKTNDTIDQLKAEMSGTMAQIGADVATVLAPALKTAAEFIGKITAKLRELTPEQTETILKVIGIISVVSPLIILGGKIVTGIGALISGFGAVSGFITATLIPAIGGLLPVIGSVLAAAAPFLIGGAIIAGIVAGVIYIVKHWEEIKAAAAELKDAVVEKWENLKQSTSEKWEEIKQTTQEKWNGIKQDIQTKAAGIKEDVLGKWEEIKKNAKEKWENIKQSIVGPIESAQERIRSAIEKIKGFFDVKLEFPHINLPHFRVSGGVVPWGLGGKGTPPSIAIDWYKKAYQNPVLFRQPTVLQTSAGLKGFGDGAGAEIVMGLDKLRQLVGANQNQPHIQIGKVEFVVNGTDKSADEIGHALWVQLVRKGVVPA